MRSICLLFLVLLAVLPLVSAAWIQYPRNLNTQRWSSAYFERAPVPSTLEICKRIAIVVAVMSAVMLVGFTLSKLFDMCVRWLRLSKWTTIVWISVIVLTTYQTAPLVVLWYIGTQNVEKLADFAGICHFWFFPSKADAVVSPVDIMLAFVTMISAGGVFIALLSGVEFLFRPFTRKWRHSD